MSLGQELYLIIVIIYLTDCLWWVSRERWVLSGRWPGKLKAAPPGPVGNDESGICLLFPIPGWQSAFELRENLEKEWASTTDPEAIKERANEAIRASHLLQHTGLLQGIALFVTAPMLCIRHGLSMGILMAAPMLLIIALLNAVIYYRKHSRLFPDARADRWRDCLIMVISFPMSARAADMLTRKALLSFQAPAVIRTLSHPEQSGGVLMAWFRKVQYPTELEAALTNQQRQERTDWWTLPEADDWRAEEPPEIPDGRRLCPRCWLDFKQEQNSCPDCPGVALLNPGEVPHGY